MERIATDILCELPETSGGNKHIVVISDYYTKWTECFAMPNMEAKTVGKLLVDAFHWEPSFDYLHRSSLLIWRLLL
jgi:hypothetical protein